jgi:hypothetical protein
MYAIYKLQQRDGLDPSMYFVLQKNKSKEAMLTQFAIKSLHISGRLEEANTKFGFYNWTL